MATKKSHPAPFEPDDYVVYPAHGVGRIISQDEIRVSGVVCRCWVISFERSKMTLRIPFGSAGEKALRKLSDPGIIPHVIRVLNGKPRHKRGMWTRREREYKEKIHSGELVRVAEVVRDLHQKADDEVDRSYSERRLYQDALDRLVHEIAAITGVEETRAFDLLNKACGHTGKVFAPEYVPPAVPAAKILPPKKKPNAPFKREYARSTRKDRGK